MWTGVHNESHLGHADLKLGLEKNTGCDQRGERRVLQEMGLECSKQSKIFIEIRGDLRDGQLICIYWLNHSG